MDLLAGAAFCWCALYVLLALYFVLLGARRGWTLGQNTGPEHGAFAALCVLAAVYAFCNGAQYHLADPVRSAVWGFRAFLFAPLASAMLVHVAVNYAELPWRTRVAFATHVAAMVVLFLAAAGTMHRVGVTSSHALALGPIHYVHHQWSARPLQVVAQIFFVSCTVAAIVVLVRAYLSGKREALLACVGGFVFAATVLNDVLLLRHVHRSIFLAEHGFAAFAFGLAFTVLARHERVSDELAEKGSELRKRTRQLRKAYEDLRAAQEELVRKEQLALVGELAAVVSHEVRNPLAIIANAVAGLRRDISADDREMLLSILDEETDRLNRLVGDLLRYARPLNVERQELDLEALLGRATDLVAPAAGIKLEIDVAWKNGQPKVFGDSNLLRQVFDNLVQNACQAMPSGGTLTVRASAGREDGHDGVNIEVSDTGEGMDTLVRSRAGTPFFTTRPGGTGLGLAICDRIVTAHGGVLTIKSRSGEGTTVSVFLPSDPEVSASRPTSDTLPPSGLRSLTLTPPSGARAARIDRS